MKLNPHFKYLRFIFFFLLILWGIIGIFDFVNFYFDWNKPLINYNLNADVNSLNLRGSEIFPEKTEGEIRILTLGDSVTYGVGFNANKSWPYQMQVYLEKMGIDATSMNAGKPSFTNEQMFIAYESLIKKGQKPDIVILYASGNLINLYGIQESYFGESKSFLKKIIPNFPNDLKLKEVENKEENFNHNKPLSLPLIIKTHEYLSPSIAWLVKKISAVHENKKQFLSAEKKKQASFGLEKEIVYLAKIISLSKETNTPIVIVKPFFLFKYEKFTISFWKEFYKFQHHFSDLSKIRERLTESDRMYEEFKEFAYVIDITNQILAHIRPESDLHDAKRIMMADYVHFSEEGYSIVGKIIGDHLLSLGLVKRHASGEWIHPKEKYIEESVRRDQYLRYREISLNYRTYKMYFLCLAVVLICLLFIISARDLFSLFAVISTIVIYAYLSEKKYVDDIVLPLRVFVGIVFSYSIYKFFTFKKKLSKQKKIFILVFFFLTSILLFINANMLSQKLSTLSNSSEILTILKENIAWSDYYQFFMKKMDYYEAFSIEELTDAVYKKQIPIPITLIKTMTSYSEAPFLFSPAIPAIPTFFSSVFKFDSVEIFFLLASIPYLVLYLFYIRIINTAFISKLKYLLYPIGLFLIKQEVDFLLPIVFLLVTLTSFGVYSIYCPVKKYPVTRYLSALAFWPLYYLVIPETLLLLGLVCVYFFLIEFYRNSFNLWSSMQNTFLWICVLFIPKLFILMLPSSKVNLDYMIQYNLFPKTFHLHSVYSFLAALTVLLFIHAQREKLKIIKRKILQIGKHAF